MRAYFRNTIQTIIDAFESLDEEQYGLLLDQCVNCVKNGGKIIASGLGKNTPICEKFVGTLNSFGIPAAFLHSNTAMHGDLGVVRKSDILLVLSKSGNTLESIEMAKYLQTRRVNTWLISFEASSKLSELISSKIILKLDNEGDNWNIVPNNSTSVYLILLQGIALNLADCLGVTLDMFKDNHPGGSIGERLRCAEPPEAI
jgi:arabinose-5-phosphate isomerase